MSAKIRVRIMPKKNRFGYHGRKYVAGDELTIEEKDWQGMFMIRLPDPPKPVAAVVQSEPVKPVEPPVVTAASPKKLRRKRNPST